MKTKTAAATVAAVAGLCFAASASSTSHAATPVAELGAKIGIATSAGMPLKQRVRHVARITAAGARIGTLVGILFATPLRGTLYGAL